MALLALDFLPLTLPWIFYQSSALDARTRDHASIQPTDLFGV